MIFSTVHSISNEQAKSESVEDTRLNSKTKIIQVSSGNIHFIFCFNIKSFIF